MDNRKYVLLLIALLFVLMPVKAQQITGYVMDAQTGDSIPFASVLYKGHGVAAVSKLNGHYSIARYNGWSLTFSAVGYEPRTVIISAKTPKVLNMSLKPDTKSLKEVTVKAKRKRYSRKNNPAVEIMKKVVEAKKRTDLSNQDFYQYNKYQKLTLALNEITPDFLESPKFKKKQWLINQIELCPYNNKLIQPRRKSTASSRIARKPSSRASTALESTTSSRPVTS